ncbi:MAG TPA: glycosyltransferase [Polyangia bacterium]|nr:glycosyltransferase [Polyangia bacterium]
MKLSACLIVRNEADALPRCLSALREHVFEIVVVDTGSNDETPVIAEQMGANVVTLPWQDDFSVARNAALDEATGDWCLMVDADEVVQPSGWPLFDAFVADGSHAHGNITVVSDTAEGRVHSAIRRLCRNDKTFRYVGRVHEQLVGPGAGGDSGLVAVHSGYTEAAIRRRDKTARNLKLLKLELDARPHDAYVHFQLGRTLVKHKQPDVAVGHFQRALATIAPDAPYLSLVVVALGYAWKTLGRAAQALPLLESYKPRLGDSPDLWFLEGLLAMETGDVPRMLRAFDTCLSLGETKRYETVEGVGSYRPHFNLGLFHELAGDVERARMHYRAALTFPGHFQPAAHRLMRLPAQQAR